MWVAGERACDLGHAERNVCCFVRGNPPRQCEVEITTGISLSKFNPAFMSSALFKCESNMFPQEKGEKKSMLTDKKVQNSVGTMISESIGSPVMHCYDKRAGR